MSENAAETMGTPGQRAAVRMARWWPGKREKFLATRPWIFLVMVVVAELLLAFANPFLGLAVHALLLLSWIPLTVLEPSRHEQNFMVALTLAPLVRLVSFALPLHWVPLLVWYLATALALGAAAWKAMRIANVPPKQVGLTAGNVPVQLLVGLLGLVLGVILYETLGPLNLFDNETLGDFLMAAPVLVFSLGFLDEFIFRGLLQSLAYRTMGSTGPIYTALLYAAMHIGHRSAMQVLAAFGLALMFGVIAHRSRSILGIGLAHGLAEVVALLVMPAVYRAGLGASVPIVAVEVVVVAVIIVLGINGLSGVRRKAQAGVTLVERSE